MGKKISIRIMAGSLNSDQRNVILLLVDAIVIVLTTLFSKQPGMKSLPSRFESVHLLAGLYFGLARVFLALKKVLPNHVSRGRAMILPSLFALAVVNIFLKLYMG